VGAGYNKKKQENKMDFKNINVSSFQKVRQINTFIYLSYSVHDQPAPLHDSGSGKEGLFFRVF
jgi:hypothetical protein